MQNRPIVEEQGKIIDILKEISDYYKSKSKAKVSVFTTKNSNYNKYIEVYKQYYEKNAKVIRFDLEDAIREWSNKIEFNRSLEYCFNKIKNEPELLHVCVDLHIFFRLYKMKYYKEVTLTSLDDVLKLESNWFRGQTNAEWQLIPSLFRNSKETKLWRWEDIYKEYNDKPKSISLLSKLREVDIDAKSNPYKAIAFIQHSIGYSQFIDFTRSAEVSLSFAISNGAQMNSYYKDDACVFALKNVKDYKVHSEDSDINSVVENAKVQIFKRNEKIYNIITNKFWQDIITERVKSVVHLIEKPTNDRMMFQKKTFIMYDNVLIIGDEVYVSFDKVSFFEKNLTKYIIDKKDKESLYKQLMEDYPQYHQRYLLDPYLYLGDQINKKPK